MEYCDFTYGLNKDGKLISISDALRGLDCECVCPYCGAKLEAKKGRKRMHHFAHYNPNSNNDDKSLSFGNNQCYYGTMHRLAEEIVAEEKCIMAPSYDTIPAKKLTFETVEIEKRIDRKDIQPDIVGITNEGKRYQIEIRLSHPTSKEKLKKLIESGYLSMEVDIRQQEMDKEKLKKFLLETAEHRKWLNDPEYEEEIRREKDKKEKLRKGRDLFLVGSNTENREQIVWKEDCFCLCPRENPLIDSYYDLVTKNMNGIFYRDEEKRSEVVNFDRNGNLFYVVHAVTINNRSLFVITIVSWDGHRILHKTLPLTYNNDYHAALGAKMKIGYR